MSLSQPISAILAVGAFRAANLTLGKVDVMVMGAAAADQADVGSLVEPCVSPGLPWGISLPAIASREKFYALRRSSHAGPVSLDAAAALFMPHHFLLADQLARKWCELRVGKQALLKAARELLGPQSWLAPLVKRLRRAFPSGHGMQPSAVRQFLLGDKGWLAHLATAEDPFATQASLRIPSALPQFAALDLPELPTLGALAGWLGLSVGELAWFADLRGWEAKHPAGPLRHYHYAWFKKRSLGARLIESPKPRLKELQRQILWDLLDRVPPHRAAHGFRARHDVVSYTAPHIGQQALLKMDLRDFFPSIRRRRVTGLFVTLGYSPPVAACLAGLCTNSTPREVCELSPLRDQRQLLWEAEDLYRPPHLPQGAPTSPALANLCAYRLDARLSGLATSAGSNFTRYADDLLFSGSGDFARGLGRLAPLIGAIVAEEGFRMHWHKLRIMRQGSRQYAGGLVLNVRPNIRRDQYDELKAILHNCRRHGATSQNRDQHPDFRAHLLGRIGHLAHIHPERGAKMRRLLEQVVWETD